MTDKPKITIIRREKFTVDHSEVNDYGDLVVTSKEGSEYKVKSKRTQLFDVFQPDIEVVVGWASYMNHEFIAEATQASQLVSADTPIEEEKPKTEPNPPNPQALGMVTKEIGDMIRSKYIKTIFGDEASANLITWYRSQVLGITRIVHDGAKLPKFTESPKPEG